MGNKGGGGGIGECVVYRRVGMCFEEDVKV